MEYLIAGSGIAGIQAAETIRRLDADSSITLIGGETFPPYCRPMISMVLGGSISPEEMVIRKDDFFTSQRIEPVLGEWVESIDVEKREVGTGGGKVYPFDRLLIATGADPQEISVDGSDLNKIFYVRNEQDVRNIIEFLPGAKNALVIGCGLVGLKIAQGFLERGLQLTMVEKMEHPLPLILDQRGGEMLSSQLQRSGIEVITGSQVVAFDGNGEVKEAQLSNGSRVPCDIAVIAIGVKPSISLVPPEKIEVNSGILINEYLETSVPGIYAAGDVTESMDLVYNERRVNAIWPVAVRQGFFAGMNMAGRKVQYKGSLVRNAVRFHDMDILAGGMVNPSPGGNYTTHDKEDRRNGRYIKLVFQENLLVGVLMVNAIEQGGILLSLIRRQIPVEIDKDRLLEPSFNYRHLMPMK